MKTTSTIWESASRPLFVRSVWLETANEGRTLRRHFILDYEPGARQRLRTTSTDGTSPSSKRRGSFRQNNSYDEYQLNESFDYDQDSYMLIGATKLTLQQQQQQQQQHQQQLSTRNCLKATRSSRRRSWLHGNRKSATCYSNYIQAGRDLYSRRSSLQDLQTTYAINGPNPEERLAERVLNWLDLAGKTDIVKTQSRETFTMGKETTTTTSATRSQRRCLRTRVESRAEEPPPRRAFKRVPTVQPHATRRASALAPRRPTTNCKQQQQQMQTQSCQHSRPDSVKPITIIFNKEGIPVRLNRPARNIDLCAMSASPSTTRRLAGQLASARLYAGNAASPAHSSARSGYGDDNAYKLTPPHSNRSQHDAKKQLHIFMPSLPKKGLLLSTGSGSGSSYPSTECDANSGLNQAFSELCQI